MPPQRVNEARADWNVGGPGGREGDSCVDRWGIWELSNYAAMRSGLWGLGIWDGCISVCGTGLIRFGRIGHRWVVQRNFEWRWGLRSCTG